MAREVDNDDTYLDRVKKLIPAEVSAGFLAINSSIPLSDEFFLYVVGFFATLILICILYLWKLERVSNIMQLFFVSFVAFPIWSLNIASPRIDYLQDKPFLASSLLVLITLVMPLVVKRPPQT